MSESRRQGLLEQRGMRAAALLQALLQATDAVEPLVAELLVLLSTGPSDAQLRPLAERVRSALDTHVYEGMPLLEGAKTTLSVPQSLQPETGFDEVVLELPDVSAVLFDEAGLDDLDCTRMLDVLRSRQLLQDTLQALHEHARTLHELDARVRVGLRALAAARRSAAATAQTAPVTLQGVEKLARSLGDHTAPALELRHSSSPRARDLIETN